MNCIDFTKRSVNLDAVPLPPDVPKALLRHLERELDLVGEFSPRNCATTIKLCLLAVAIAGDDGFPEAFIARSSCGHKFAVSLAPEFCDVSARINAELKLDNFGACKCKGNHGADLRSNVNRH